MGNDSKKSPLEVLSELTKALEAGGYDEMPKSAPLVITPLMGAFKQLEFFDHRSAGR